MAESIIVRSGLGGSKFDFTNANVNAKDMISGVKAFDNTGNLITGNMTNHGNISTNINPGGSYTIPAGYHDGGGIINASNAGYGQTISGISSSNSVSGFNFYPKTVMLVKRSDYGGDRYDYHNMSAIIIGDTQYMFEASWSQSYGTHAGYGPLGNRYVSVSRSTGSIKANFSTSNMLYILSSI